MNDTLIFREIVNYLFEYCKENHINKITYLEVEIPITSQVNKNRLLEKLIGEIPELVNYDMIIKVNKLSEFELVTIKAVEGVYD